MRHQGFGLLSTLNFLIRGQNLSNHLGTSRDLKNSSNCCRLQICHWTYLESYNKSNRICGKNDNETNNNNCVLNLDCYRNHLHIENWKGLQWFLQLLDLYSLLVWCGGMHYCIDCNQLRTEKSGFWKLCLDFDNHWMDEIHYTGPWQSPYSKYSKAIKWIKLFDVEDHVILMLKYLSDLTK